jgi:hypothetical protein
VNAALLEKRGRVQNGQQPGANQQPGKGHNQPKLAISLFELRELLADLRQNPFSLPVHCTLNSNEFGSEGLSLAFSKVPIYGTKVMENRASGVGP